MHSVVVYTVVTGLCPSSSDALLWDSNGRIHKKGLTKPELSVQTSVPKRLRKLFLNRIHKSSFALV